MKHNNPVQLWIVCLNGNPTCAFDNEARAMAFHDRRVASAYEYATKEAIDKSPAGPFVWTVCTVPYNVGDAS